MSCNWRQKLKRWSPSVCLGPTLYAGVITVGSGSFPGTNIAYQWEDSGPPLPSIQHLGLSCWDKHVSYRNVALQAALPTEALKQQWQREQQQQREQGACEREGEQPQQGQGVVQEHGVQVPSLLCCTMQSLAAGVCADNVCQVLQVGKGFGIQLCKFYHCQKKMSCSN